MKACFETLSACRAELIDCPPVAIANPAGRQGQARAALVIDADICYSIGLKIGIDFQMRRFETQVNPLCIDKDGRRSSRRPSPGVFMSNRSESR